MSTDDTTLVDDLRALADFLEQHPTLDSRITSSPTFFLFADDPSDFQNLISNIGSFEKKADDNYIDAEKMFGRFKLQVTISRSEMCERMQVGTRTVEVDEYPDDVVPIKVVKEEPVFEWSCPPSWRGVER